MDPAAVQKALLTARLRDALRRLGYAVPAGTGPATAATLAALAPAIAEFAHRHGVVLKAKLDATPDPMMRASLLAELAEEEVRRVVDPTHGAVKMLGALAAGFMAYRSMKKAAGGQMENLTLSDMMKLINTTVNGLR